MNLSYIDPLRRAWARSQRMLFRPFNLKTWLVLGFAAFLSEALASGNGARYSIGDEDQGGSKLLDAMGGVFGPAIWTAIGMLLVAAIALLAIILIWVNSRGRFVFLDGVARERAAIVEPWKRCARQGNSLFVWAAFFLLACLAVAIAMLLPFVATLAVMWRGGEFHWGLLGAVWILLAVAIPFAIVVGYTVLFLSDFVIPIMYRHDLGVMMAWRRFLALFRTHPAAFLLYGPFVFTLWLGVGIVLMAIGLSTCCVGFVLFGLPYVSSVVMLPALVMFRALGPEFLAQFGPEYATLVGPAPEAGAAQVQGGGT